jgi:hypothetical protein
MSKTCLKEAVPAAEVAAGLAGVRDTVTAVIADIRARGDEAVRACSAKFDNWSPDHFRLTTTQIEDIVAALPGEVCGRASRVEVFEGHARSGDIRAAKVTGAGNGLGRAIAVSLAAAGARVVLVGRTEETLRGTAEKAGYPERSVVAPCDVAAPAAVERLRAACRQARAGARA